MYIFIEVNAYTYISTLSLKNKDKASCRMAQTGPRKTLTGCVAWEKKMVVRDAWEKEKWISLPGMRHLGSGKENGPLADAGAEEIYGHDWEHESRM
jgi:hypothetical protein